MKIIWVILLSTLAVSGCHAGPENPEAGAIKLEPISASSANKIDGAVKIRFDELITHLDLELHLLEINDSRCPTGVQCFWAGEATVILEATDTKVEGNKPVELKLTLQAGKKPVTASAFGYELELLSVNPYPKHNVTPERSYSVAEIKIYEAVQN
jgi:hypothetical protein